ncbi:MAG: hypothetical protein RL065_1270 [Bacteroidota bacterium]|jgi:hypothetical protein
MRILISTLLFFSINFSFAQIPNYDFEIWTSAGGYEDPSSWSTMNYLTNTSAIYTCIKASPSFNSQNFIFLITRLVPGIGLVKGRIVSGEMDTTTSLVTTGFPFTERPIGLNYYFQFMNADPTDSAFVSVTLTKWNSQLNKRDTIGTGLQTYNSMNHSWSLGQCGINYHSSLNPDTACIEISASSTFPQDGSFIYIDELSFYGLASDILSPSNSAGQFHISQTQNSIFVTTNIRELSSTICIFDLLGRRVYQNPFYTNQEIPRTILQAGTYIIRISTVSRIFHYKVIL